MTKRVAILISGRGSNMRALCEAMASPDFPAKPVLILSNRPDAAGLDYARAEGLPHAVIDHTQYEAREAFDAALDAELSAAQPDLICLAGFMRLLTPGFVEKWAGKLINIHPSLLPKYPGLKTHQRALDAGDAEAGCTVHYVVPEMDAGEIIGQARVPVLPGDTAETLEDRVREAEHTLYPDCLLRLVSQA
ncbi:phosphoribosylglycinamide formyltransferase [Hyphobacterium sp. CCMP332]|uniref:phosphoribosylglycinamide formyltransferase n=1 Tax=Hyphobacterium sp. CCMP332 TaxID=2749086 RepID=UPI00164F6FEE|nr:phosphoribosylglycinamide formyltransferase [Hyphobacterium sp. CCMP332]QNL18559.1 phosphoribosylglycinamide formyltransferase [Hyphobacterium sp. CCMP332]